ncbi:MAG: DUF4491 family protein [Tannerella sp.]|jgi:hypothetical protein|nr:DUF4491 family protein [Tannerella sp.]
MEFIETYHLTGLVIGFGTFCIIGIFHPLVIKGEYYFGVKCWWAFLLFSIAGIILTVTVQNVILSSLCGVFAFSALWGIGELFYQRKRVEKGWFPKRIKKPRAEKNRN